MNRTLRPTAVLAATLLLCTWLTAVSAAAPAGATITGSFTGDCLGFEAQSTKTIGYVEIHYTNGGVTKDDTVGSSAFSITGTDQIAFTQVKSTKTLQRFDCTPVPLPRCSDGEDNDGDLLTDFPSDPGCTDAADEDETDPVTGLAFHSRWLAPDGSTVIRRHHAALGTLTNLNVDDDPEPDLVASVAAGGPATFTLDVDRAVGEMAALPLALEAVLGSPALTTPVTSLGREQLAFGFDALDDRTPAGLTLTTTVTPALGEAMGFGFDLDQESPGNAIALTAALFNGTVSEPTDPIRASLRYDSSPVSATAAVTGDGSAGSLDLDARLGSGSLVVDSSQPLSFIRLTSVGPELRSGANAVEVEVSQLPGKLSVAFPESGLVTQVRSATTAGVAAPTGQLRLAVSPAPTALPAFVSDAQYNANPSNVAFRDNVTVDATGPFTASLRLTGITSADIDLDPVALTLDQDGTRTRPLMISGTVPNSVGGQPATTVSGLVNKPSARTVITTHFTPGLPIRLTFENATPVASISLGVTDLGSVPSMQLALSNVPTRLTGCLDTSSSCRRADRLPTALANYPGFQADPAQSSTAGGQNRPYPAAASVSFNDLGTSGTSAAISSMVTLNAQLQLVAGMAPIEITNARFHALSLDVGLHPTSPTFTFLGSEFPRIYVYVDSMALPFVLNRLAYPPVVADVRIGTDGSPANGNNRLAWLPGTRCTAFLFGVCVTTALDQRTSGTLNCGGQRSFVIREGGINYSLLDHAGGVAVPVCS